MLLLWAIAFHFSVSTTIALIMLTTQRSPCSIGSVDFAIAQSLHQRSPSSLCKLRSHQTLYHHRSS
ncbi:MAG: hypothetical protein AB4426_35410 [Xenococcaceae cyanobacterium]